VVTVPLLLGCRQPVVKDSLELRLLDALLTCAPTAKGVDIIAMDIITASAQPDGLGQLTDFYITGLLLPSKPSMALPFNIMAVP
jgi:hypothetical protein